MTVTSLITCIMTEYTGVVSRSFASTRNVYKDYTSITMIVTGNHVNGTVVPDSMVSK